MYIFISTYVYNSGAAAYTELVSGAAALDFGEFARHFVKVLRTNPRDKRDVKTAGAIYEGWGMNVPLLVQMYTEVPSAKDVPCVSVAPDLPAVIDIDGLSSWAAIRWGTREWQEDDGVSVFGLKSLGLVHEKLLALPITEQPLAVILHTLHTQGWKAIRESDTPHLSSDRGAKAKSLCIKPGFASAKNYFRCLLRLKEYFKAGLKQLACTESDTYYKCILNSTDRVHVSSGLGVAVYRKMLAAGTCNIELPAISDTADAPPALAVEPPAMLAVADEIPNDEILNDEILNDEILNDLNMVLLERDRPKGRQADIQADKPTKRRRVSQPVEDESCESESGSGEVLFVPTELPSSSSSALSKTMQAHSSSVVLPNTIEGVTINEQLWVGEKPYYRKLVTCPFHEKCGRRRNMSDVNTAKHGSMEVVAFLGCWLKAGSTTACSTKALHGNYYPSDADVTNYMKSM